MNKLIFDETTYDLALNGLSVSNDTLVAKIVDDNYDFEDVEAAVAPIETIKQTLEDGTQIASYKGFTKLVSINKLFNQVVDQEAHTHEQVVPKIDPETGKPVIDPETGEEVFAQEIKAYTRDEIRRKGHKDKEGKMQDNRELDDIEENDDIPENLTDDDARELEQLMKD